MSARNSYSKERMTEAALLCSNIDEVIAFFGTHPYGHLARYLFRRFAHFGIDVSHFARPYRKGGSRPAVESLRDAVSESTSIAETLRRLRQPDNGSQRALLRQWIADDGLTTAHFLGQAHQRGKPGRVQRKAPEEILIKHSGKQRARTVTLRLALREIGVPEECAGCGTGGLWQGRPMTLEIDHVNGDWTDDRPENLRLLCPNCHAITSTWCRGGRRRRGR
ncbi:HNH endonuclease [Streptomyces sp. QH1-20]|uniref:HNH endonuclease n=1 Tax=Streptomyces sp. QH1-20 TaxID=3240934 RepID=UPI0035126D57